MKKVAIFMSDFIELRRRQAARRFSNVIGPMRFQFLYFLRGFKALLPVLAVFCVTIPAMSFGNELSLDRQRILQLVTADRNDPWLYGAAFDFAKSKQDHFAAAAMCNMLGMSMEGEGQPQSALKIFEDGLKLIAGDQPRGSVQSALNLLSGKSYTKGSSLGSDLYQGEIVDLRKLFTDPPEQAEQELSIALMLNAGNMYAQQNQFQQADILYRKALEAATEDHLQFHRQQILTNLAWLSLKKGRDLHETQTILEPLLSELSASSPPIKLRRAFLAAGVVLREQKHYSLAIPKLEQAVSLYVQAQDNPGTSRALTQLGAAYLQAGDLKQAEVRYLSALELSQAGKDAERWHLLSGLANTYQRAGNVDEAIRYYRHYWDEMHATADRWKTDEGRTSVLEQHDAIVQDYVRLMFLVAARDGTYSDLWQVIESVRGCILGRREPLDSRLLSAGELPGDYMFGEARLPFERLVQFARYVGTPCVSQSTRAEMEKSMQMSGNALPRTTVLQYYVLDDQTIIMAKSKNGLVWGASSKTGAAALEALIDDYLRALGANAVSGVTITESEVALPPTSIESPSRAELQLSTQLYDVLVHPVGKYLPADPNESIAIIPHRMLWRLPFAALQDEQGNSFNDQHVLTYVPSEATWQWRALDPRPQGYRSPQAWVVGDPETPKEAKACRSSFSFEALPGSRSEAITISGRINDAGGKAELFLGMQADRLRLVAWHPAFTVIHLSTHGVVCPGDPLGSFVALTELKAADVNMDWESGQLLVAGDVRRRVSFKDNLIKSNGERSLFFKGTLDARTIAVDFSLNADLVTLSACQTGLGKVMGQGLIGFSRAFLAAGARSLLVSLWKVDDAATQELMVEFYEEYLRHFNKGLALQRAMKRVRTHYPDTRLWAAFTLHGLSE